MNRNVGATSVFMKIEFPLNARFVLWHVHNRMLNGQIVLVWQSGPDDYMFSFHDQSVHRLPPGKDWRCVGELVWEVEGDRFIHHLLPLRDRSEAELRRRARATARHKVYREECWRRYSLKARIADLQAGQK